MKAFDEKISQILAGTHQFVIPVFQRDYNWTELQCEQLWNDILDIAAETSDRVHFVGSVVSISTDDSAPGFSRWLLIDGQQRLTTLTLLLAAMRDHIKKTQWKGTENSPTANRLEAYFLKNPQEDGEKHHKLLLRRHDHATLKAILDGTDLPENPSEPIQENYDYFYKQLETADLDQVYKGFGRLVAVNVLLNSKWDDPQLIFESLNSTGMDLNESDLIRNFILMRLPEREQTRLYEQYWCKLEAIFRGIQGTFDNFFRDYMALKTQASKQEKADQVYQSFRTNFSKLKDSCGGLEQLMQDMLRFGNYYAAFALGTGFKKELTGDLARLRKLVDVPALLVIHLFDLYDRCQTLTLKEFKEALRVLESYVFRRAICGEQSRGYWQIFANLAHAIGNEQPLENLKAEIARQREAYRFPSDSEFKRELLSRDVYSLRVCSHLLEWLENDGSEEPSPTGNYSIEHILPQNPKLSVAWQAMLGDNWKELQQIWLHRLGNLTLTGYNSRYSDRSFDEKKTMPNGFNESAVRLNQFVREQQFWTAQEIEQRGNLLAEKALQIWPSLKASAEAIERARQKELQTLAQKRDVAKVPMSASARELFNLLRQKVLEMDQNIVELAEQKSVSYHGKWFFLEVLPRKERLSLLLPLDYSDIEDPHNLASDATEWKFLFYAKYEGGVLLPVWNEHDIDHALPMIKQAFDVAAG